MIDDLVAGWKDIEAADAAYCEAEDQYSGDASETFASREVEAAIRRTGEDYKMPLISQAVNVLASRCEVRRISSPGQQDITEWIEKVWKANQLAVYYPEVIVDTCKLGDYYVMIWDLWGVGETPEDPTTDAETDLEEIGVEWTIHSPKRVRLFYDPENERRKAYALKRWPHKIENDSREYWRVDLYYPDHIERWLSVYGQDQEKPEGWETFKEDIVNRHGAIPFFHHRTKLLYGESVMKPGYGAQNAFTKMTVSQLTTSEAQAFGERVALTDPDAVLDENLDSPDFPEDDESLATSTDGPLRNSGGLSTSLRGGAGTWKILNGIKSVEQLDQADPDVFMDPAEFYLNMLSITTQTPLSSLLPRVQPESGDAKRIAETPLIERARKLQTILAATIEESWRFALKIAGKNHRAPLHVSWSPTYQATSLHDWQGVNEQLRAGVPQQVALVDAGYELEQVQSWMDTRAEQMTLDSRVDVVKEVMAGMQAGGLAGVLGVTMGASGTMGTPSGPVYDALLELLEQATQQETIAQ